MIQQQAHDRTAALADGVGVAYALGAIAVGEGQDRGFLTAKALNGVGALDLGLQIDQTQLDALDLTHAHPRSAGAITKLHHHLIRRHQQWPTAT